MDFANRGPQGTPLNSTQPESNYNNRPNNTNTVSNNQKRGDKGGDWSHAKFFRLAQSLLALCVLVVVIGLMVFLAVNDSSNASESSYIQNSKLQAVFLNTGQVYFGNIKSLNNNYLVLTNIFYLQTSSSGSSSSSSSSTTNANTTVSLVKLGCEIHAPLDQMIINRSSVTFWENLSATGQVSKAVATWEKDNPDGQKCSDQSTAGTSGQSTPQSATDNTTGSTGTTSTGTTGTTSTTGASTTKSSTSSTTTPAK
jgi:hypothetical protein